MNKFKCYYDDIDKLFYLLIELLPTDIANIIVKCLYSDNDHILLLYYMQVLRTDSKKAKYLCTYIKENTLSNSFTTIEFLEQYCSVSSMMGRGDYQKTVDRRLGQLFIFLKNLQKFLSEKIQIKCIEFVCKSHVALKIFYKLIESFFPNIGVIHSYARVIKRRRNGYLRCKNLISITFIKK